jgi:hypothetical protein
MAREKVLIKTTVTIVLEVDKEQLEYAGLGNCKTTHIKAKYVDMSLLKDRPIRSKVVAYIDGEQEIIKDLKDRSATWDLNCPYGKTKEYLDNRDWL